MADQKTSQDAFMDFFRPHLETYLAVIKKFTVFEGRTQRKEFWMFCLYNLIISVVFGILTGIPFIGRMLNFLSYALSLAIFVVSLAIGVRRLHDTDRSGLTWLLGLIPLVGIIIVIVFWAQEGTPGDNKYGSVQVVSTRNKSPKTTGTRKSSSKKQN
jgi:uncharacterized membrane protein YhaH (DUF805 family)